MQESIVSGLQMNKFDKELAALCEKYDVVTLDQLIHQVQEQGFFIQNMFQLSARRWQCNLRKETPGKKDDVFFEYGKGHTPEDALLNAQFNANTMLNQSYMVARKKVRR